MTLILGCIADDYTGASDLANTLTKNGLRTIQIIGIPSEALNLPAVDAVVISLKIRSVPAPQAVAQARQAAQWLRARGANHVMYKICSTFDSTDQGNIGPVLDALRADAQEQTVLVTPAFPETGRTVYKGHLFVGSVLLSESPLKDHPLNPMHDSNLVRVLARQSQEAVGLVDHAVISQGVDAIRAQLSNLAGQCVGGVIADAVCEQDLETLGEVALGSRLSVGASGLGLGLARGLRQSGGVATAPVLEAVGGLAACIAGSCSAATREQIMQAEPHMPVLRLDPEKLLTGPDELQMATQWALARVDKGPVLIASSATPAEVARLQAMHGHMEVGHVIEQALAELALSLVTLGGVRRLVVAGGETSGAIVDKLRLPAFILGPEIAAGVPVLQSVGHPQSEMLFALKSGNFGGPSFFTDALAMMR